MKTKILIALLIVSVSFGLVELPFVIGFLSMRGHLKSVKQELKQTTSNLAIIRGSGLKGETADKSGRVWLRTFISQAYGQSDVFTLLPPTDQTPSTDFTLAIYLHGMGSTNLEPFVYPPEKSVADSIEEANPRVIFASLNYRGTASWGSDAAMSDISQNIRQLCQEYPVKRIIDEIATR